MFKIEVKVNIYGFMPLVGLCHVWYVCSRGTNTEKSKINPLKGGITKYSFFAYFMFSSFSHTSCKPKPLNYCVVMILRIMFLSSKNKIFKIWCLNRGFPKIQKIFFFKNSNIQNAKTSPVLNIFRWDRF